MFHTAAIQGNHLSRTAKHLTLSTEQSRLSSVQASDPVTIHPWFIKPELTRYEAQISP